MNAQTFIEALQSRGALLEVESGRLRITPANALTDADREAWRAHKAEILRALSLTPDKPIQSTLKLNSAAPHEAPEIASQSTLASSETETPAPQSTLDAPEPPPRDGATWMPDKCVWHWRHWIMRTRLSIELEKSMLAAQHRKIMALPELYPNPATPQSTLAALSLSKMQTLKTDKGAKSDVH